MNPLDIFLLSIDGLSERKFRFALNLVGILIGCAAITGLISMTQGLQTNVSDQLDMFGPTNLMIIPGDVGGGPPRQGGIKFNWRDVEIISKLEDVKDATPIISNVFAEYTIAGRFFRTDIYGVTPKYKELNANTQLASGRNFKSSDSAVVIVGSNVAHPKDLDEPIVELGDRIKIMARVNGEEKTLTLRVIGILEETGGNIGANL
ncbi:ABC transporter permease, partial [Candidatus Bathyarchaeota archaeon]|nr:ABC transporter permease [Candidatus Bathyarchaeota archaeon]